MDAGIETDTEAEPSAPDTLEELVQRAQAGDRSVLPELGQLLDSNPSLWQRFGDLAQQAQAAWLTLLAGENLVLSESVQRKLTSLKEELAGPEPSRLETLLVERVVACWLQCHYADCLYAQARGPKAAPAVLRELMHRQESAQRRYLAAIKQLALVRKLLTPAPAPIKIATRLGQNSTSRRSEPVRCNIPEGVGVFN